MKYFKMVALLICSFATSLLSLTTESVVMADPLLGKKVIVLGECHASYIKMLATKQELLEHDQLYSKQEQHLTHLAQKILTLDPKKGARLTVITETPPSAVGCLFEQEAGLVETQNSQETITVVPRIFIKHIVDQGTTTEEKIKIFQQSVQPFNSIPGAYFSLKNKVRWVAGDTSRDEKDAYLGFEVYQHWKGILTVLENKETLPDELAQLTIGNVKRYIESLHTTFRASGIVDRYASKVLDGITAVLKTGAVSESDHIALLHAYLHTTGQEAERDLFNSNVLCCIAYKFDVELGSYIKEFQDSKTLSCLLVSVGADHARHIKTALASIGYVVVEKSDTENYSTEELDPKIVVSNTLTNAKNNSLISRVHTFLNEL